MYVIVEDFVLHLAYYRALSNGMKRFTIESNFLAACAMANLYVAALNWCKVFGSNDNEVHWKKLRPKDERKS